MDRISDDESYINIVSDILYNDEYKKIENNTHHGLSRLEHCLRVSYYSYKLSKILKLNYIKTARAGLLHDFFVAENKTNKQKIISMFKHPLKALNNSKDNFNISTMEADIIETHMFPLIPYKIPKYIESWIVSGVDKLVAIYEFLYSYGNKAMCKIPNGYALTVLLLLRLGL